MRILAIRGCNLASLAGRFEVDLSAGALGRAGLYAITGPTGAGKSTLLDALTLALFDRTPRLAERGGVLVGRDDEDEKDRLASNDVRGILRRGAGEGWAEVDFRGRDRRSYRARWSVRRARGRTDGRLQNQTLELHELDSGAALGGTKTETLDAIEARLGLSFDQFRRSVLLAQGDFAAFLRAAESERAELLETMTGTDVYGRLSVAAHDRARAEQAALDELESRALGLSILPDDERAAQESEAHEKVAAAADAGAAESAAQGDVAWYEGLARLVETEREASRALAERERTWEESAARRAELAAVEDAERLRGPVERLDRTTAVVADGARAAETRRRDAGRAAADTRRFADERDAARGQAAAAQRAFDDAQPAIRRAATLDAGIGQAERALDDAERARRDADGAARRAEGEAERARDRCAAAEREREEAARWLADRPQVRPLAEEWPRWEAELARHRMASVARRAAEVESTARERDVVGARETHGKAAGAQRVAEDRRNAAAEALRAAEEAAAEVDPAALAAAREATRAQRDAWAELVRAADDAAKAAAGEARETAAAAAAETQADRAATAAVEAERASTALAGHLAEAERALELLRTALSLDAHRADLRDGEPCPLCGAATHPWGREGAPGDVAVAAQRDRVGELRARRDALTKEAADSASRAVSARETATEARERARAWGAALTDARRDWDAARQALEASGGDGAPHDAGADDAAEAARAGLAAAAQRFEDVRKQEQEADGRVKTERRLRSAFEAARSALDTAGAALREAEEALRRADQAARDVAAALERAAADEAAAVEAVAPAFLASQEPWRDRLRQDPEGFARKCARAVEEWRVQAGRRDTAAGALETLRPDGERLGAVAEQARRAADEKGATRDAAGATLRSLREERGGLLDGRPTDEAERLLKEALERARDMAEDAARILAEKETAQAHAEAAATAAEQALAAAGDEQTAARAALDEAVRGRAWDEVTLRARLACGEEWIRERQVAFARLDKAVQHARGELAAGRRQREAHEAAATRPTRTRAEADAAFAAARARREGAEAALQEARVRLAMDDDARRKIAALRPDIEAHERRCRIWEELRQLIGSADGKKYRMFAQSLTLEALLLEANHQLADLTDRYEVVRVPGTDLALQVVDRHMGDEIRAVTSLSGGESFLVSLALALGLSALSATGTRIESLFIDEGFGSLDPATLDTALHALDALQASGRQVGLISHVPGLAERIGVRVEVVREGAGRSAVLVASP